MEESKATVAAATESKPTYKCPHCKHTPYVRKTELEKHIVAKHLPKNIENGKEEINIPINNDNEIILPNYKISGIGAFEKNTTNYILPKYAKKNTKYVCIDPNCKNRDLIFKNGEIKAPHFAHKSNNDNIKCGVYDANNNDGIHNAAQILLKKILEDKKKVIIQKSCNAHGILKNIEIPIITDKVKIINEFSFNFNNSKKRADVAYVENNNGIQTYIIFEICHTHETNKNDRPEPWYEFNATDLIENINTNIENNEIKLDCIRRDERCPECDKIKSEIEEIKKTEEKGIIYFNQRGAGCGKTYESIQLIQNDKRFENKDLFIYLTKAHTAREVIYNEFIKQINKKDLNIPEYKDDDSSPKKNVITFINNNKEITIIIASIDSFTYAIADRNKISNEKAEIFYKYVQTIKNGYTGILIDDTIRYANKRREISKNALIIIDEAQDLEFNYFQAFDKIREFTNIDVYIIGDLLQSIYCENNLYTHIEQNYKNNSDIFIKDNGKNIVKRFHNIESKNFVNDIIPFTKFNLPEIENICDAGDICEYKKIHVDKKPVLFEVPKIYADNYILDDLNIIIDKIFDYMDDELLQCDTYAPNNFMFIFPLINKNNFAELLETRLCKYWNDKFKNEQYKNKLIEKDIKWKEIFNKQCNTSYAYLHKSDKYEPINLKLSKYSTRILSIHASKGNGCDVVFVLGVTENTLNSHRCDTNGLKYNSLLHVAITRHKKMLYFGLEKKIDGDKDDDIRKRLLKNILPNININLKTKINCSDFNTHHNYTSINDYILLYPKTSTEINDIFIKKNKKLLPNEINNISIEEKSLIKEKLKNKQIIDWGHHVMRKSVFDHYIYLNILNELNEDTKNTDQYLTTIRKKICDKDKKYPVKLYDNYTDYYNILNKIHKTKNKDNNKNGEIIIPLLRINNNELSREYKYGDILKAMIENIQNKIQNGFKQKKVIIPELCPLECVLLYYILQIMDYGVNHKQITVNGLYNLLSSYDIYFNSSKEKKHIERYNCKCDIHFNNKSIYKESDIQKCLSSHYEIINLTTNIILSYKKILDKLQIKNIKYNIKYPVYYNSENNDITLNTYFDIIGYSENYIINIIISPQFNEINFDDLFYKSLFDNLILLNQKEKQNDDKINERYEKFNNKKIYNIIFTLDSENAIDYTFDLEKDNLILKKFIYNYIFTKYSPYNEIFYYNNIHEEIYTCDDLLNFIKNNKEYIFQYMKNFFNNEEQDLKRNKNKQLKNIFTNKDNFVAELNYQLKYMIEKFLDIEINDEN